MASHFTHDGNRYEIVERPTFGECEWVERQSGQGFEEMGGMTKMAALVLLSVRRKGVPMTWAQVRELSPADLVVENDAPAEDEADPTTGGASEDPA
jgi:hypothetical protein